MPENSESARKEKAERLRKEIDKLSKGKKEESTTEEGLRPESAAEFVHRRMREIDQKPG
jgi:hypothetical protein